MSRKDYLLIAGLVVSNLILRLFRLDSPAEAFFDERVFYLDAARSYLTGFTDPNFEHPPLGKILISLGIWVFGDNPWGWRVPSALFGTLGIIVTYLLAKKIFKSTKIAVLSSFFLTFDFLWFIHSRAALLEIFLATFSLLAIYFFWNYYREGKFKNLVLTGVFLGLALAVKWSAVFVLLGMGVWLLAKREGRGGLEGLEGVGRRLIVISLVSLSIYFLSYLPYLSQNHALPQVWERQVKIWNYHTREIQPDAYGALRPYLWWLNPPQLFYHPEADSKKYILGLANPFLFWGGLIALTIYLKKLKKSWNREIGFLVVFIFSLYLPWFLVGRYVFFYYFLTGLPLLAILLAKGLTDLEYAQGKWGKRVKSLRSGFITGNALGFFLFYPLLSALPVTSLYLAVLFGGS